MWNQFFLQNAHFALNLLAAFVFFAVFWLYYDAWIEKRSNFRQGIKIAGFLLLAFSYLLHASTIESTVITSPILGSELIPLLSAITKSIGYLFLIISLIVSPLQPKPESKTILPLIISQFSQIPFPV